MAAEASTKPRWYALTGKQRLVMGHAIDNIRDRKRSTVSGDEWWALDEDQAIEELLEALDKAGLLRKK